MGLDNDKRETLSQVHYIIIIIHSTEKGVQTKE